MNSIFKNPKEISNKENIASNDNVIYTNKKDLYENNYSIRKPLNQINQNRRNSTSNDKCKFNDVLNDLIHKNEFKINFIKSKIELNKKKLLERFFSINNNNNNIYKETKKNYYTNNDESNAKLNVNDNVLNNMNKLISTNNNINNIYIHQEDDEEDNVKLKESTIHNKYIGYKEIKDQYKNLRDKKKSSIFKSEDLYVSNTNNININLNNNKINIGNKYDKNKENDNSNIKVKYMDITNDFSPIVEEKTQNKKIDNNYNNNKIYLQKNLFFDNEGMNDEKYIEKIKNIDNINNIDNTEEILEFEPNLDKGRNYKDINTIRTENINIEGKNIKNKLNNKKITNNNINSNDFETNSFQIIHEISYTKAYRKIKNVINKMDNIMICSGKKKKNRCTGFNLEFKDISNIKTGFYEKSESKNIEYCNKNLSKQFLTSNNKHRCHSSIRSFNIETNSSNSKNNNKIYDNNENIYQIKMNSPKFSNKKYFKYNKFILNLNDNISNICVRGFNKISNNCIYTSENKIKFSGEEHLKKLRKNKSVSYKKESGLIYSTRKNSSNSNQIPLTYLLASHKNNQKETLNILLKCNFLKFRGVCSREEISKKFKNYLINSNNIGNIEDCIFLIAVERVKCIKKERNEKNEIYFDFKGIYKKNKEKNNKNIEKYNFLCNKIIGSSTMPILINFEGYEMMVENNVGNFVNIKYNDNSNKSGILMVIKNNNKSQ